MSELGICPFTLPYKGQQLAPPLCPDYKKVEHCIFAEPYPAAYCVASPNRPTTLDQWVGVKK